MGAQKLRRLCGKTRVLLQASEKPCHAVRVEAGAHQQLYADAVRLLFVGAGEIDARLRRGALHRHQRGLTGLRVLGGDQDGAQHGRQSRYAHLLGHLHGAGHVFLGHVGDFMGHHAGQLTLAAGVHDHAAVNADNAPGRRKRIDQRVVDDEERELLLVVVALRDQPVADRLDVVVNLRIGDNVRLFADLTEKRLPQPSLKLRAQDATGGIADIRQIQGGDLGPGRDAQE